nr:hypothetical protein [uncultured Desulfuromonas sp.]
MAKKHQTLSSEQLENQAKKAEKERQSRYFNNEEQQRNMKNLLYGPSETSNES